MSYHKDRRYHKRQARLAFEHRNRKILAVHTVLMHAALRHGLLQVAMIRSTPAPDADARVAKAKAIAMAVLDAYQSAQRVAALLPL